MEYINLINAIGVQGFIQGEEYRARCPMHDDTHPSFSMNLTTGLWVCHRGCGQGNFPQLVEKILNCSNTEAWEWVNTNSKSNSVNSLLRRNNIGLVLPGGPNYLPPDMGWHAHYKALDNNVAPLWFLDRGFTWKTINHWDIRYDPATDAVIIPVWWDGELVGTITRAYQGTPKYLNSSGLPRAEILFGEINRQLNSIILCEGVLDTLWAWQNGYNVAGLLGTFISQRQIEILRGYGFGEIVLALDNDEAGRKGTKEAKSKLIKAGWMEPQITAIQFPTGIKDLNDCDSDVLEKLYNERKELDSGIKFFS